MVVRKDLTNIRAFAKSIVREYAYLDNMPLEGSLWEMIRRHKECKRAYEFLLSRQRELGRLIYFQEFQDVIDIIEGFGINDKSFNNADDEKYLYLFLFVSIDMKDFIGYPRPEFRGRISVKTPDCFISLNLQSSHRRVWKAWLLITMFMKRRNGGRQLRKRK